VNVLQREKVFRLLRIESLASAIQCTWVREREDKLLDVQRRSLIFRLA
jgi:hypothetical protein